MAPPPAAATSSSARTATWRASGQAADRRASSPIDEGDHDVAVALDSDTLLDIGSGKLTAREAIDRGRAVVEKGDPEEVVAFASFLRLPTRDEVAVPA